jgi:hypothetical protein
MSLGRKDAGATLLTALAVLVFAATQQGWNIWLVGGGHRWAAGAITALGAVTCGLGSPGKDTATRILAVLGMAAGALAVISIATGSLTALELLIGDIVLLWAASLYRHAAHGQAPIAV